jgi:transcription elongation factor GreB
MSRRPKPTAPRSAVITPEGVIRLREEYQRLWSVERPKVAREVGEAAALGDRSENAEYIYGKRRLREIDSRLEFLNKRLDELRVVSPEDRGETGRISMDSPLGSALLGKSAGDEVAVQRPKGDALFEITGVRYRS